MSTGHYVLQGNCNQPIPCQVLHIFFYIIQNNLVWLFRKKNCCYYTTQNSLTLSGGKGCNAFEKKYDKAEACYSQYVLKFEIELCW